MVFFTSNDLQVEVVGIFVYKFLLHNLSRILHDQPGGGGVEHRLRLVAHGDQRLVYVGV